MSSVNCPRCHYPNPADHHYCQNCGSKLDVEAVDETPPSSQYQSSAEQQQPARQDESSSKSNRSLYLILAAAGVLVFCGLFVVVLFVLALAGGDSSDDGTGGTGTPELSSADLEPFQPDPAGGDVSTSGETVSSDSGTLSLVVPEGNDWDVLSTEDGFVVLEHDYGFLEVGVYRSDFPTTPEELMDEELEWMQEEFPELEVVAGPDSFEFENGTGIAFATSYDIDLFIIDVPELDVYVLGVDESETVVIWINFYGLADEWDSFAADVEPIVRSIRSPLFE